MSKSVTYEILNKEIFQVILNQSDVRTVTVQHNVKLQGKTTSHQIDVYWEFELSGIIYRTIVQAKDWSTPVNKGELIKFKGVLDDLPGQPRGIFVTRTGYQKGADEVAKANGIDILELQEMEHESLKIKAYGYAELHIIPTPILIADTNKKAITLAMECIIYEPKFESFSIKLDSGWLSEKLNLSKAEVTSKLAKTERPKKRAIEHKFYDEEGNIINDLDRIYKGFINILSKKKETKEDFCYKFDNPTYIQSNMAETDFLKVLSISVSITIKKGPMIKRYLKSPDIVHFILKNLNNKTETVVGKTRNV